MALTEIATVVGILVGAVGFANGVETWREKRKAREAARKAEQEASLTRAKEAMAALEAHRQEAVRMEKLRHTFRSSEYRGSGSWMGR